jgi:hypothetical protein
LLLCVAEFVHREQHAAMHRLQAVADVGQRAPHDHAHGVIEVALAHLVFDVDADNFLGNPCRISRLHAAREGRKGAARSVGF